MPDADQPVVACPICNGPLTADATTWRCEVGHKYSFSELAEDQAAACVRTLWYALRSLEDRALSSRFAAASYEQDGFNRQADLLLTQSGEDLVIVDQLHALLQDLKGDEQPHADRPTAASHDEQTGQGSHS